METTKPSENGNEIESASAQKKREQNHSALIPKRMRETTSLDWNALNLRTTHLCAFLIGVRVWVGVCRKTGK